jgi:hypothetical protein
MALDACDVRSRAQAHCNDNPAVIRLLIEAGGREQLSSLDGLGMSPAEVSEMDLARS